MKKPVLILISIIIVLALLLIINSQNILRITGLVTDEASQAILNNKEYKTMTKAICNSSNFCQDYIITCENKIMKMNPIEGAVIQHPKDWEDSRENENLSDFCR